MSTEQMPDNTLAFDHFCGGMGVFPPRDNKSSFACIDASVSLFCLSKPRVQRAPPIPTTIHPGIVASAKILNAVEAGPG